jgi:hypothetical protein
MITNKEANDLLQAILNYSPNINTESIKRIWIRKNFILPDKQDFLRKYYFDKFIQHIDVEIGILKNKISVLEKYRDIGNIGISLPPRKDTDIINNKKEKKL